VSESGRDLHLKRELVRGADRILEERQQGATAFSATAFRDVRADRYRRATHLLRQAKALARGKSGREPVHLDGEFSRLAEYS
jgi:hypothetical protein